MTNSPVAADADEGEARHQRKLSGIGFQPVDAETTGCKPVPFFPLGATWNHTAAAFGFVINETTISVTNASGIVTMPGWLNGA